MDLTPYEALQACLDKASSQSALARDLGVSQPTVWRWLRSAKRIPAEYVLRAEKLYGVSRHLLRPDIYPVDLPPFASNTGTVTSSASEGSCDRQAILQRDVTADQRPAPASTPDITQRQENRK